VKLLFDYKSIILSSAVVDKFFIITLFITYVVSG
jgi:hypothetical protein